MRRCSRWTKQVLGAGLVAGMVLGTARWANAALMLGFVEQDSGGVTVSTQSITDNGVGDLDPTVGSIIFKGAIGEFQTDLVAGTSNHGSGLAPLLQLESLNVRNTTANLRGLTVNLADTDFAYPSLGAGQLLKLSAAGGGTLVGASPTSDFVNVTAAADPTNTPFAVSAAETHLLAVQYVPIGSDVLPQAFSGTGSVNFTTGAGPYSVGLSAGMFLSAGGQANISGTAEVTAVPEPATIGLGAMAASGLLLRRRRIGR